MGHGVHMQQLSGSGGMSHRGVHKSNTNTLVNPFISALVSTGGGVAVMSMSGSMTCIQQAMLAGLMVSPLPVCTSG
jgi:hypothetical protein